MALLNFLLKRTSIARKRPQANLMAFGELNLNYDSVSGGVYFKDSAGDVRKVGPAQVGPTAPNDSPAGSAGHSTGEIWFDTLARDFKIWDGTKWLVASEEGNPVGRMYWDGNPTATTIGTINTWRQFNTSIRSLGAENSEFVLDTSIVGLRYTGTATRRMVVTLKGRFDSSPNTSFQFGIARTSTGTSSLPADVITDSVASLQDSKLGDIFLAETVILVSPNNVIYPVIKNTSSATNATMETMSMIVNKV